MATRNASSERIQKDALSLSCKGPAAVELEKGGFAPGSLEWWREVLRSLATTGYQDQTGFYFGDEPTRAVITYPSFW